MSKNLREWVRLTVVYGMLLPTVSTAAFLFGHNYHPDSTPVIVKTLPDHNRPKMVDILTVAMVVSGEVGDNGTDEAWLEVIQTAENRMAATGRQLHEEFRAVGYNSKTRKSAAMFSPMNGLGPVIDKGNIDRYGKLLEKAERVLKTPRKKWRGTHFYSTDMETPPGWAASYEYLGTSFKHNHYYDNGEVSYRLASVPNTHKVLKKLKPRLKKKRVKSVNNDPVRARLGRIFRKMNSP